MKFLRTITWQEVFAGWREREANNPDWIHCATVIKGWPDWESWRQDTAKQLGAPSKEWGLYLFESPELEAPTMLLGPYNGWQKRIPRTQILQTSFDKLLSFADQYEEWVKTDKVQSIIKGLPFATQFIGFRTSRGDIICIDGHHRSTAIALAHKQGLVIDYHQTRLTIAIADISSEDEQLLKTLLEKGTSKER